MLFSVPNKADQKQGGADLPQAGGAMLVRVLAEVTVLLVVYIFVAAINSRATVNPDTLEFQFHSSVAWLPHSFDSRKSWAFAWKSLALACTFWAARDWLCSPSMAEWRQRYGAGGVRAELPRRVHLLMAVLVLSGGLLALEGITQRALRSPNLLFLVKPEIHQTADTQFASFAYRSNAAQYFNLLWPVGLGLWWLRAHSLARNRTFNQVILACSALMAACPLISGARGAAIADVLLLAVMPMLLLYPKRRGEWKESTRLVKSLALFLVVAAGLGFGLGWHGLRPRMEHFKPDLYDREELYRNAGAVARDYSWFGTGPGTFESVYQMYRPGISSDWPAQLHNDWLETRITFGRVGCGLLALFGSLVLARFFLPAGVPCDPRLVFCLWLSLGACLLQARWDFPLQVYSIQWLFLMLCALLSVFSRNGRACRDLG